MPQLPPSESLFTRTDTVAFLILSELAWLLQWAFIIGIVLGLARLAFIGALAFAQWARSRRRYREHTGEAFEPFVFDHRPGLQRRVCDRGDDSQPA
jgi:hypothetical protein